MDPQTARDVARGLRDGRPEAWRTLYDAFAERVWRGVARLVGPNAADVADVVQETMLSAARSARTFDPARGSLWNWLWGIARLEVALHFRKQTRRDRLTGSSEWLLRAGDRLARWLNGTEDAPPDLLEAAELGAVVRAALNELSPEYESLLTAKYLDGEPVESIAEREGCTEVAVRSKLARARGAFREVFLRLTRAPGPDHPAGTRHEHPRPATH